MMALCKGCDCEAEEGEQFCNTCREEVEILNADFIKYEMCVGGCREGCSHDPRHL